MVPTPAERVHESEQFTPLRVSVDARHEAAEPEQRVRVQEVLRSSGAARGGGAVIRGGGGLGAARAPGARVRAAGRTEQNRSLQVRDPDGLGQGKWSLQVRDPDGLGQGPDVVVREPQSLDLGEFGLVREGGQNPPQRVQRVVQVVHPVPFTVVGLQPPVLLHHLRGCGTARAPAAPLLLQLGLSGRAPQGRAAAVLVVRVWEQVAAAAVGVDRVHVVRVVRFCAGRKGRNGERSACRLKARGKERVSSPEVLAARTQVDRSCLVAPDQLVRAGEPGTRPASTRSYMWTPGPPRTPPGPPAAGLPRAAGRPH